MNTLLIRDHHLLWSCLVLIMQRFLDDFLTWSAILDSRRQARGFRTSYKAQRLDQLSGRHKL